MELEFQYCGFSLNTFHQIFQLQFQRCKNRKDGDAVNANFFQLWYFFGVCELLQNFVVFLQNFENLCMFLHAYVVLIFKLKVVSVLLFATLCSSLLDPTDTKSNCGSAAVAVQLAVKLEFHCRTEVWTARSSGLECHHIIFGVRWNSVRNCNWAISWDLFPLQLNLKVQVGWNSGYGLV